MLGFNPESSLDENQESMEDNLSTVKSGQVTTAIRDTEINGFSIKKDQFMGIVDGDIVTTGDDLVKTATDMVAKMLDDDSEAITVIWGDGANESLANQVQTAVSEMDDELEIEVHEGDQPVYPFLISVE